LERARLGQGEGVESSNPSAPRSGPSHRILLVASEDLLSDEVFDELKRHAGEAREIHLVAPAVAETRIQHVMGGVDEGIEEADARLSRIKESLGEHDFEVVEARIGDADPVEAISDTLLEHPGSIDEVVMVTPAGDDKRPLEKAEFERARDRFDLPLTHIEATREGIVEEEEAAPGEHGTEGDVDKDSTNLPPVSRFDLIAIIVGVVGTLVLIVLAANCAPEMSRRELSLEGCEITFLLAGAFFLINVAHVFALTLFQAERYRGVFDRFFAGVSLYGTTAAVIVGLILA
jgi:hypothetical protein